MPEKIIETKNCNHCKISFNITDKDLEFYEKVSPIFGGKKYLIPSPKLCPECRLQNRFSFINERKLYKRICDATGKSIISNYSQDKPYKVYDSDYWLDCDDFTKYGRDFDFTRPFFEQYNELFLEVPRMALDQGSNIQKSSYNNYSDNLNNCYMCINTLGCDSCFYCSYTYNCENCIDCFISNDNRESYECISCKNCYKLYFSQNCNNCTDSFFLKDCIGCNDCLYCVNLVGKKYHIFNEKYSKEDYEAKKKELINSSNLHNNNEIFKQFKLKQINKAYNITNSENCSGDDIENSKNIKCSFSVNNSENVGYSFNPNEAKNCYDCDGYAIEKSYYTEVTGGGSYNCLFCIAGWENCSNLIYCDYCFFNCSNLFGCIGLKNKSYCILNKQYTKEEYEILVPKIIQHMMNPLPPQMRGIEGESEWGEFFPSSISPFGYNETVAMEYFPINPPIPNPFPPGEKGDRPDCSFFSPLGGDGEGDGIGDEKIFGMGFNRSNYEAPFPKVEKVIKASMLPENISDIPDDILNWAIESELESTDGFRPLYRIIKQELEFYRKHNLPIPKRHPDQRHLDRMSMRNPRKLYDRKCDKCGIDMKTTYSPEREEIVYCEECYVKEVY